MHVGKSRAIILVVGSVDNYAMSIKQVLENTRHLNSSEKALLAHCLIASLDSVQEEDVEDAWFTIAEKRFKQMESGEVKGISWDEIKADIQG